MVAIKSISLIALFPAAAALVHRPAGQCSFATEPDIPYFWDPNCAEDGMEMGCFADGVNTQCRFCGEGAYREVFCPADLWCEFDNPPTVPYYWDARCVPGMLACNADGRHVHCRFCGEYPYNGTVHCPDNLHTVAPEARCEFANEPSTPYFYDVTCEDGMVGCKADGKHLGCRFCGEGAYAEVNCPASLCTLPPSEQTGNPKHYWEPKCQQDSLHILGCLADGVHPQCRFCGGGDYESIRCPELSSY